MDWYCFRVHQKKEHFAARNIYNKLALDVFCPRVSQVKGTRVGKKRFTEAMFPCYLFAKLDLCQHLQAINGTCGVVGILKYGSCVPIVPERFIQDLRGEFDCDILYMPEPELMPKKRIRVLGGPFQGLIGELIKADRNGERLTILMDLLGTQVDVKVPATNVVPVSF